MLFQFENIFKISLSFISEVWRRLNAMENPQVRALLRMPVDVLVNSANLNIALIMT